MLSSIEVPNVCLKAGFRVAVVSRRNGFQISGKSFTKKLFLEKARSYMFNIAAAPQIKFSADSGYPKVSYRLVQLYILHY